MNFSRLLTLLSVVIAGSAASMVLHERRAAAPAGFVSVGAAPASEMITLRVALTSNNVAGLQDQLLSMATPGSSNYRQWLSKPTHNHPPTLSRLSMLFASANGLTPTVISPNGDWVSITLPILKANTLFAAKFERFTHPALNGPITRTLSVSLPSELVGHVDVIHPTTAFVSQDVRLVPGMRRLAGRDGPASSCNSSDPAGVITPTCLQELYGIPTTAATETSNALLVTGYGDIWAQQADLSQFLSLLRPDISPPTTFTLLTADNGTNPQGPSDAGIEANLDIQYTAGIATSVPLEFLSVGGCDFPTALFDTTTFLDGVPNPPSVMTTSYGDTESNFGASVATKICNGYMALGARGISVIFASGDGGVRGGHDTLDVCTNNTFMPVFPAACPFVTSVGSTQGFAPEKAINFTGGGFSNVFPAPQYQTAAVAGFLETIPSDFPGMELPKWSLGARSFSKEALKPVLGFLNPFLYSKASSAFADVTIGHNSGFECPASSVAFDAAVGWDALTGLGTPKFSDLLDAAFD
ncbi:Family S53 protease-like protein [Mycena sanguinolenta]|uniref:Family S53 protease-like protein n=1 Tax=Mycena sanguinolenta TaxID=230812 RepID=A0A8H6YSK5_9AGAR|nr:Family S53 protease-like protein [Mycena sanguinolenta]